MITWNVPGCLADSERWGCRLTQLHPLSFARKKMFSTTSRSMSTTSGKDKAEPGIMFGFGRRQKPAGSEKIGLGKGHDLMEDDPGARKKVVISG